MSRPTMTFAEFMDWRRRTDPPGRHTDHFSGQVAYDRYLANKDQQVLEHFWEHGDEGRWEDSPEGRRQHADEIEDAYRDGRARRPPEADDLPVWARPPGQW